MENIKKEIIKENENLLKTFIKELKKEGILYSKKENNYFEWILQRKLTNKQFEKFKNKEITKTKAIEKAIERKRKEIEKRNAKELQRLEDIEKAEIFTNIEIVVSWSRSSMWGYNPHAVAKMWNGNTFEQYEGKASGCGYDKQSAAIATALNQSKGVLKLFADYKEKQLKKRKRIDKDKRSCSGIDNRNAICYGFGYAPIPYFEGGTGTNCFIQGFKLVGFEVIEIHTDKVDCYRLTKKEKGD